MIFYDRAFESGSEKLSELAELMGIEIGEGMKGIEVEELFLKREKEIARQNYKGNALTIQTVNFDSILIEVASYLFDQEGVKLLSQNIYKLRSFIWFKHQRQEKLVEEAFNRVVKDTDLFIRILGVMAEIFEEVEPKYFAELKENFEEFDKKYGKENLSGLKKKFSTRSLQEESRSRNLARMMWLIFGVVFVILVIMIFLKLIKHSL